MFRVQCRGEKVQDHKHIARAVECSRRTHLSDELGFLERRQLAQRERPEIRVVKAVHRRLRQAIKNKKKKTSKRWGQFAHPLRTAMPRLPFSETRMTRSNPTGETNQPTNMLRLLKKT